MLPGGPSGYIGSRPGPAIVQAANFDNNAAGQMSALLPQPVVAGNILVAFGSRMAMGGGTTFIHGGVTQDRPFTALASVESLAGGNDVLTAGARVATGDEQWLDWYSANSKLMLYEIKNAKPFGTWSILSATLQGAASAWDLGAFAPANLLQLLGFSFGDSNNNFLLDHVFGGGWIQDVQDAFWDPVFSVWKHPGYMVGHAKTGPRPQTVGGSSAPWAGIVLGIK